MADEDVNEEQWLYGDSNPDKSNDAPPEDNLFAEKLDTSLDSNAATQVNKLFVILIVVPAGVALLFVTLT